MTVAELIDILSELPPNMQVVITNVEMDWGCGCCSTGEITTTQYAPKPQIVVDTVELN